MRSLSLRATHALRHLLCVVVLTLGIAAPKVHAFDFWSFLANLPAPAKLTINSVIDPLTVEMVLGAKTVFDSCQDFSEPGILKCIETLNNNPDFQSAVGADGSKGIEMALSIYIDIRTDDYLGLLQDAGKPIACILASSLAGGFPVCSALDALFSLAEGLGDAVGAFFSAIGEGVESACEWVGLCDADNSTKVSTSQFVYLNVLKPAVDAGVKTRMLPETKQWFEYNKALRDKAQQLFPLLKPSEADWTQAFTAYYADVFAKWDALVNGYDNQQKLHALSGSYYNTNALALSRQFHLLGSDGEIKVAVRKAASPLIAQSPDFKVYAIWHAESPTAKTAPTPLDMAGWADSGVYYSTLAIASSYRVAQKAGCSVLTRKDDFASLKCDQPTGMTACASAASAITGKYSTVSVVGLCDLVPYDAGTDIKALVSCVDAVGKVNAAQGGTIKAEAICKFDRVGAEALALAKMKALDPKGYCRASGSVITCARDVPVWKVCKAALAGGNTLPQPFALSLTCTLSRSSDYQSLVNHAAQVANTLSTKLADEYSRQIKQINAGIKDPKLHIPTALVAMAMPDLSVKIASDDPLLIEATLRSDKSSFEEFAKALRKATGLPLPETSDFDNAGEGQAALLISWAARPPTREEKELLDRIKNAAANATSGTVPNPGAPGLTAGVANPVINPGDFARLGAVMQRVMAAPGLAMRLTSADVEALRSGLVATSNPKAFKVLTPAAGVAFGKLQAAAPLEGLLLVK
ncbi:MAG: hypothetical protein JNL19_07180 [Burkholderiales bacterium]|nr:hypothetical protein [Burkholderiales bacterium]